MPTPGDLKSGDSLFCTTPHPPPQMSTAPLPPSPLPTNSPSLHGSGHYVKSYKVHAIKIRLHVKMSFLPEF